jgi:dTDP-glucose 4,6-dehydratase
MPTAVVTGGAGFLGSHLCDSLAGDGYRVICVDSLETGSLQNVEHLRGDSFVFVNHDLTRHVDIDEPVDLIFHLASPASPIDYLRLPLQTLKVGLSRTHNALGSRRKRALSARIDERGLRRPADPPAAGDVLGQREPDRPAWGLRRGEATRRRHDGVSPPAGRRHVHRAHLQHLRPRMRPHDGRAIPTFVRQASQTSR